MASKKKLLQAAAGAAGAEALDVDDVFSTYLYTGTSSALTITNGIDLSGEGGLVWLKGRSTGGSYTYGDHELFDTETEGGNAKYLNSARSDALAAGGGSLVNGGFNSNGFSLKTGAQINNRSGDTTTSWTFRKAPKFFDIVTYTGTGSAQNISHNLGSVPGMIITKRTSSSAGWGVYHRSKGATAIGTLNSTSAWVTDTSFYNDTEPTSTQFTVGGAAYTGQNTQTYVAYLFAHNDGDGEFGPDGDQDIIKCGSYTGVSATEISVDLGFEPQWVMIKRATGTSLGAYASWFMQDTMRGMVAKGADAKDNVLYANKSSGEGFRGDGTSSTVTEIQIHPNATGFTVPSTNSVEVNQAGETYIYMAIRRGPLAAPEDATDVFDIDTRTGSEPSFVASFEPDMAIRRNVSVAVNNSIAARLTGNKELVTNDTAAESSDSGFLWDYMDGWANDGSANSDVYSWMWKRAPEYFDVVAYTGSGGASQSIDHNLGVVPEMIWVKDRGNASNWSIYHSTLGISYVINFDTGVGGTGSQYWGTAAHTSSVFKVGSDTDTGGSGRNYIAYLFASLDGVSKVGSYTGNGSTQNIDCGFSSGARFVLIKRTDSSDGWKVHDSVRGIVAGNDPFVELNNTNAENSSFDLLDPYSGGFAVNNYAGWNASGGSYIFYAIA